MCLVHCDYYVNSQRFCIHQGDREEPFGSVVIFRLGFVPGVLKKEPGLLVAGSTQNEGGAGQPPLSRETLTRSAAAERSTQGQCCLKSRGDWQEQRRTTSAGQLRLCRHNRGFRGLRGSNASASLGLRPAGSSTATDDDAPRHERMYLTVVRNRPWVLEGVREGLTRAQRFGVE